MKGCGIDVDCRDRCLNRVLVRNPANSELSTRNGVIFVAVVNKRLQGRFYKEE
jgi:hypothetical protein